MFADPALPESVQGDAARLRQVLVNLASNAIKFCAGLARPGRVSVRGLLVQSHSDHVLVEFRVRDNGIGMDEATLDRVFNSFTQADTSTTRKYGGTGLGLVISRQLASLMGGDVSVSSTVDEGSTFTARVPFVLAHGVSLREQLPDLSGLT